MDSSQLNILYRRIKNYKNSNSEEIRDLTVIHLTDEFSIVIAVDSDGGIGPQEGDTFKCDPYQLGHFAIRVPLLELLSCGASPLAAFDMLSLPMNKIGKEIVRGVRDELKLANLGDDFPLSGSTEDNVPTNMTSIGTTIIGLVNKEDFNIGKTQINDFIVCVGLPKSAPDDIILLNDSEIINQNDIYKILELDGVHEILPVGSKGVANEAHQLAKTSNLDLELFKEQIIDVKKSGGPSTCVIVSCLSDTVTELIEKLQVPVNVIGKIIQ